MGAMSVYLDYLVPAALSPLKFVTTGLCFRFMHVLGSLCAKVTPANLTITLLLGKPKHILKILHTNI